MIRLFNKNLEENLLLVIKVGIFLLFLTPLVLVRSTTFPALIPKAIYFRILVEIIFFLYVLLLLKNPKYLPKFSPLFIVILIYFEVLGFSTWRSINPERSFWGTMERMEGFINFLHIFAFYLILVGVFRERKDWINLLRFTVLISVPIGLAAIIQKLGIYYFFTNPADPRLSATLGNSVLYGNYLTLIIFLTIFFGIFEEKRKFKVLFWGIFIFNLILLLFTGTRSAWLGTIAGAGFLFLVWFFFLSKKKKKERQVFLFAIFIILLFFLLFLLFSELGFLPHSFLLARYESLWLNLIEFRNSRFLVWDLGIRAWKDSPIFGFGPEVFNYVFDKYYRASMLDIIPENLFFDRAHNQLIDVLVVGGLIGLVSYLGLFATAIFMILRNYKKEFSPVLSFVLISFFLGHFIQNIFSFDTINSYVVLFLLFGFIDVNFRNTEKKNPLESKENYQSVQKERSFNPKIILIGKMVIIISIFSLIASAVLVNIRFTSAAIKLAEAHHFMNIGQAQRAFESLEKASEGPSFMKLETYYYSAETVFFALPLAPYKDLKKEFSRELQKIALALENHLEGRTEIFQMRGYLMLARIYRSIYLIEKDKKYLEDEERVLGGAIKLNPEHPAAYRLAANMRFHQNRKEEGVVLFGKTYELDKNLSKFYESTGMAFIETGEKAKGVERLRKGLRFGDFYKKGIFNLKKVWDIADIYEEIADYKNMADFYEEVISHYPEGQPHPQIFASLSTVYAKMGDKKKARETTYKMLELYPGLKSQAEQFLNNLDNIK